MRRSDLPIWHDLSGLFSCQLIPFEDGHSFDWQCSNGRSVAGGWFRGTEAECRVKADRFLENGGEE